MTILVSKTILQPSRIYFCKMLTLPLPWLTQLSLGWKNRHLQWFRIP